MHTAQAAEKSIAVSGNPHIAGPARHRRSWNVAHCEGQRPLRDTFEDHSFYPIRGISMRPTSDRSSALCTWRVAVSAASAAP